MNWLEQRETPCEKCGSISWLIASETNKGGHQIHPLVCGSCGYRSRVCAPKKVVQDHARKAGVVLEYAPSVEARQCEVCGTPGAEHHHWAPYYLFGPEADRWPKGWLCQSCHARWHRVIASQQSERAA